MTYREIETALQTEVGIVKILDDLQANHFQCIDYNIGLFRNGSLSDTGQLQTCIDELTGIYMDLQTYYMIALVTKINRENSYYHDLKITKDKDNVKMTHASLEKDASFKVANERRVLHILEGKINSCEKAISTCQSRMRLMSKEIEHLAK